MWESVKLSEIVTFVRGLTYSKKDEVDANGLAVLRATNVSLKHHKIILDEIRFIKTPVKLNEDKLVKVGDILMCTASGSKSHLGKCALVKEDLGMAFGGFMAALRCKSSCLPEYLFYILTSNSFMKKLSSLSDGANINNLKFSLIEDFEFLLPPLEEQERIVAKLDAVFAEIDEEIKNIEFKIRNVSDLYQTILDSAVGKNKTIPLIDVCHRITDGSHYSPKTLSNEYPYITVKDICDDKIDFNNCKYIDKTCYEDLVKNNCKPRNGDLLFSKDGTVGKVSLVDYEKDFVVLSSLAIISPNENFIIPRFLFYTLKSKSFIDEAVGKKTGAAIRRIILKTLKNIKISVPELNEQTALIKMLDKLSFEQAKLTKSLKLKMLNMNQLKHVLLKETLSDNEKNNAA